MLSIRIARRLVSLAMLASCGSGIDFGNDSGPVANNGICDDRRFTGERVGYTTEERTDATDCRKLLQSAAIRFDSLEQPEPARSGDGVGGVSWKSGDRLSPDGTGPIPISDTFEELRDQHGRYAFQAPRSLFRQSGADQYVSDQLRARISIENHFTQWFDETGIFSKEDLINRYRAQIRLTYSAGKDDWFVLSGYQSNGDIVYIRGLYSQMASMEGRDTGEPTWLWSKSAIIKISYPEANKAELDTLVPLISRSFTWFP